MKDAEISKMRAVTISREYGSGGGEIAARLAKRLGWHLIDHEVVVEVAKALGVSEAEAETHDEHVEGIVSRILSSLTVLQSPAPVGIPVQLMTGSDAYDEARRRVVEGALAAGRSVIVGRGAQILLRDRRDVFHVRIVAGLEERIAYVMQRERMDRAAAQVRIQHKDRDRVRFLAAEHHESPEDAHLYDLTVNTNVLDLASVVDLLAFALECKAKRLSAPANELGPGAGLQHYTEPPADFHPHAAESSSPPTAGDGQLRATGTEATQ